MSVFSVRSACVTPPPGLVGWWQAEGDAQDSVGGNHGILPEEVGFAEGEVGRAFSFSGNSAIAVHEFEFTSTNISVEAWINPSAQPGTTESIIFGQLYGIGTLSVRAGTNGVHAAFTLYGNCGFPYVAVSTNELPLNQFSHVVGTWDGQIIRVYVDGALQGECLPDLILNFASDPFFYIGGRAAYIPQYFNGLIDEVSLYDRALSVGEVMALFSAGSSGKCSVPRAPMITRPPVDFMTIQGSNATFNVCAGGSPPLSYQWRFNDEDIPGATNDSLSLFDVQPSSSGNYSVRVTNVAGSVLSSDAILTVVSTGACVSLPAGLVGWWQAEGDASDLVGAHDATPLVNVDFAEGKVGQAFAFSGNNALQITNLSNYSVTAYSIEAWINPLAEPNSSENQALIFGQSSGFGSLVVGTGSTGVHANLFFNSATFYFEAVSTNELPLGQFSHVVGTWDGSRLKLYINGILQGQSTPDRGPNQSTSPVCIGGYVPGGQLFNGLIDEVSFYDRPLSALEILTLFAAGANGKCGSSNSPPVITRQPADITIFEGHSASFNVMASGSPPLSYQWRFDDTDIPGATNRSLVLSNVQPGEAGNYSVLVTNAAGSATSSNALLTVLAPGACDPAPPGLVSWWRAESDACDSWGINHGDLLNQPGFVAGKVGQAWGFAGSNAVSIPCSSDFAGNHYTVEAWINPAAAPNNGENQAIVFGQPNGLGMLHIRGGSTGVYAALLVDLAGEHPEVVSSNQLPLGQWSHIVGTWDGAVMRIYVDGKLEGENRKPGMIVPNPGSSLYIGGFLLPQGGNRFFTGSIDEVSFYDRSLSALEIATLYEAGSAGKCQPAVFLSILSQPSGVAVHKGDAATLAVVAKGFPLPNYQWRFNGTEIPDATNDVLSLENVQLSQAGVYSVIVSNAAGVLISSNALLQVQLASCVPSPSGLVGWWRAEGDAVDSVGANNGTLVDGASFTSGRVGQAFNFSGNNQYVEVQSISSSLNGPFSLEAWVKPNSQPADPSFGTVIIGQSDFQILLVTQPGYPGIYVSLILIVGDTAQAVSTNQLPLGRFSHIAATWDGAMIRLYVNGVLCGQQTASAGLVDSDSVAGIGGFVSLPSEFYFDGTIDEVSVYNRALSGEEILSLCGSGEAGKCPADASPAMISRVIMNSDHSIRLDCMGTPGYAYRIQYTDNLENPIWHDLGTATADSLGGYQISDIPPANVPVRFYRAVWP